MARVAQIIQWKFSLIRSVSSQTNFYKTVFWKNQFCFLNKKIRQNNIRIQFYNTDIIISTVRLLGKCEERLRSEPRRNRPKGGDRSPEILTLSQKGRVKTVQT